MIGILTLDASQSLPDRSAIRVVVGDAKVDAAEMAVSASRVRMRPKARGAHVLTRAVPVRLHLDVHGETISTSATWPYHADDLRALTSGRRDPAIFDQGEAWTRP